MNVRYVVFGATAVGITLLLVRSRRKRVNTTKCNEAPARVLSVSIPRVVCDWRLCDGSSSVLPTQCVNAAERVSVDGVCVIEGVFDEMELSNLAETVAMLDVRQTVSRRAGRWEFVLAPAEPVLQRLGEHPVIKQVLTRLLGARWYLEKAGRTCRRTR